jgi:signal transduction histidine kinase
MPATLASVRTRILGAILAAILVTDCLAVWFVNDRVLAGAHREADSQARLHSAQVRALYEERARTLAAEGEAVSFYPAVIAALEPGNTGPLLDWSSTVATLQGTSVTVVDATGTVVARGHAPAERGDELASRLEGLRLALGGQPVSGTEDGDELGLALRGYAPVFRGATIVGAIMIADRFDEQLLARLGGGGADRRTMALRVESPLPGPAGPCDTAGPAASCRLPLLTPAGRPAASLVLFLSLADINAGRADAQQALWVSGAAVLVGGGLVAWLLARSLTRSLAQLTAAAHRIAGGVYDGPSLTTDAADEVGVLARAFEIMRTRVGATTATLRDERDVLEAVLESAGDGILMVDPSGKHVVANTQWAELLNVGEIAAATKLRRAGRHGPDETFANTVRDWLADPNQTVVDEFERSTQLPADYRRLRCYSAPVRRQDGALIGRILVLRDVTRESEAERMRSALVSNVSHELRSPLTAIKGYVETLRQGGPWEVDTEQELLTIITEAADRLTSLVDDLLDAAKLDAGVLALDREPMRIGRVAERILAQRRPLSRNHELRLEAEPDLPIVQADPLRVEQVITNLVDNAIKYSPAGGTVTVRIRPESALRVEVTDHGIGVTPEQATHLFERFYRAETGLARTTQGIGLGLYICRSLVEAHGGRIGVESAGPGQGSTFWFTLPVDEERVRDGSDEARWPHRVAEPVS